MLKIGHRGAAAYEPENTLRSFMKAVELGVNAVELDVRKTGDDHLVVIHDAEVDRTTNGRGLVNELTLEEIKQLTTGKGERIPTLGEALNFLGDRVRILIELKEGGLEEKVLELLYKTKMKRNVIVVSFHEEVLERMRELDRDVETGLIYVRHENPADTALRLGARYLLPFYRLTNARDVKRAHEMGLKVIVWTINDRAEVLEYAKMNVDGIASDMPDVFECLNEAGGIN